MMDDMSSTSDGEYAKYWTEWFLYLRGNEYFVEVDEEYIADRFNLTGLNQEVDHYVPALQLISDELDESRLDEHTREAVDRSARHLYGLIHARYVLTTRGMHKILDKYKGLGFGRCPRVLCNSQPLLPVGLSDIPGRHSVKLYCCHCEDVYNPKSTRHATIDGAYFGTSLPHMIFQMFPTLVPEKSIVRYEPKIFGFKLHATADLHRKQDKIRDQQAKRLVAAGIEPPAL
ncbi:casein kinase 2 regulatory subunit [Dimargaris verticillata]|uniref:Casein kinase II subunit beta n=1 Tax=Dimargaris verticillata TaxID=2761393 RepID=A0A9W8EB22_9FUNG|nr:casein kinase 2 regulatory subunit [Dimargaris verticillata]